jgi:phage/plasmid-like protein (TIGR03299 family)
MAHQVESMFSVRETPWHKLGVVVTEAPTAAEAIRLAGLDWCVIKRQLQTIESGTAVDAYAVVRETDGAIVGDSVGPNWTPLQNHEAFDWFNPFVESGLASFETAGSLQQGRRIWILAQLNRQPMEIAPGDTIRKYLLLSNSHDGSLATRVGFTPIRVVCANTLAMAHNSDASKLIRFKHTKSLHKNLQDIQETVNAADAQFEATAEQYRALARKGINHADLKKYVKTVFKMEENDQQMSTRSRNILESIICRHEAQAEIMDGLLAGYKYQQEKRHEVEAGLLDSILDNFETGRGQDLPSTKGTWFSAYNAISEHLAYERGRNEDSRLNQLWFGQGAVLNTTALETAIQLSGIA